MSGPSWSRPEDADRLHAEALASDARIAALITEVEGLRVALESRAVIDQAKGVLMSTMHVGPDAAFAVLVAASQREHRKLRDIAGMIVDAQDHHGSEGLG